jgi:hypothetical protein
MINSYKSATEQLNKLNQYMNDNTENLFINIELYTALMDIRDRFQKEIANYELLQRKINSPYAKVLKKRGTEMERINRKDEERKEESIFEEELSVWFD